MSSRRRYDWAMERCYAVVGFDHAGHAHVLSSRVDAAEATLVANRLWRAVNQSSPQFADEFFSDGGKRPLRLDQLMSIKVVPFERLELDVQPSF